jgi:hypothetical protein
MGSSASYPEPRRGLVWATRRSGETVLAILGGAAERNGCGARQQRPRTRAEMTAADASACQAEPDKSAAEEVGQKISESVRVTAPMRCSSSAEPSERRLLLPAPEVREALESLESDGEDGTTWRIS